jgi:hypothetical protein
MVYDTAKGIDYDLSACLEENPQDGYGVGDIALVLAVWEGQNDGDDWRWILRLNDERFVFLIGGCDYTGWDCQSWASSVFASSPIEALEKGHAGEIPTDKSSPQDAGVGHMIDILSGESPAYGRDDVHASLRAQLEAGKNKTWRENKDEEMGYPPRLDI